MSIPALLLFLACGSPEVAAGAAARPAALVAVAPVREGTLDDRWSIPGDVRALERSELAAGATGRIVRFPVREGDRVAEGDLLVEVDPSLASAELRAARAVAARDAARLRIAQQRLERLQKVDGAVVAADELDAAQAEVDALAAAAEAADAQQAQQAVRLGRHRVTAPYAGVVTARRADVGDWATEGQRVVDLVQIDPVEILVDAPPELAASVAPGDGVSVGEGTGTLVAVVPALDPTTRTARLRITPEAGMGLVPGGTVEVVFAVQRSGGLVVPRDAVVPDGDDARVFRVEEGTARALTVRVLASAGEEVLVQADGLAPGDPLVVRGNERLRPDQPVTVQP